MFVVLNAAVSDGGCMEAPKPEILYGINLFSLNTLRTVRVI